jgi:hypothetical protein
VNAKKIDLTPNGAMKLDRVDSAVLLRASKGCSWSVAGTIGGGIMPCVASGVLAGAKAASLLGLKL